MLVWKSTRPAPPPQRWQSREEITKAHLESLPLDELRRVRPDYYWLHYGYEAWKRRQSGKANFNPNQPRVPAGNPDGGQWTSDGSSGLGSGLVAYADVDTGTGSFDPDTTRLQLAGPKVTIDYSEALTGISRIDDTTKSLIGTLAVVVATLPDGSGPLYGIAVHRFFALAGC